MYLSIVSPPLESLAAAPVDSRVVRIALSVALGLFLGLEREWSQKAAGIRTFALVSVLGTIFTMVDTERCAAGVAACPPYLSGAGALFVIVVAGVLMLSGMRSEDESLHLTTAVSLLVAYGVGVLVALGAVLPATVVAVTSSILLVFKRELHGFAWDLSREELRSTTEFAILAFVIYPVLPPGSVDVGTGRYVVEIEPRVVWLVVVFVAGIGILNYVIVKTYGGRGIAVTGFFGGLASSTAVVGTMLDHVGQRADAASYAVAGVLLANAAMALRNLLIVVVFTLSAGVLLEGTIPLLVIVVGSVAVAAFTADWSQRVEMDLESPFSMRNALGFGAMFLVVVVAGGLAQTEFGSTGLYVTAVVSGLVSSAGATTSAVVVYRTGAISGESATIAVLLATASSVAVKVALSATSSNREFAWRVAAYSAVLLAAGGLSAVLVAT
ncbi:MgtC/SapB family protein [Halobacterium litoreum]|uniref:MgtC/SapB family protein n=1 Tax=Halobacterium litoreum TaxID=2039234 RepID=A0ABD5NCG9_9EURY|nr:MgtC/SapB family protein [Halobacterium litoreum]UHH14221.1 MgtC/SapB family protein [Halobacterium litoreum]